MLPVLETNLRKIQRSGKDQIWKVKKSRLKNPRFSIVYDIHDSMGIFDCSDNMPDNHNNERQK